MFPAYPLRKFSLDTNIAQKRQDLASKSVQQSVENFPKVAILLCTYHGQQYLAEQIASFEAQTYQNWEVWASDDGSNDDTHAILESYRDKLGVNKLSIHYGPKEGFVANFLSLTCHTNIQANYYAYSDQDDIWKADKLQLAVDYLSSIPETVPAIYCSRTRLVDHNNQHIGFSPLFNKPTGFANALMQNVGGGNTMVINNAARKLLCEAGADVDVITHDWWAYLVVCGCGGRVFYDPKPTVRYRQHDSNLVGMNSSWPARFVRMRMLFQGRFRTLNDQHIQALNRLRSKITPENILILDQFIKARNSSLLPRLIGLKKSGIYRQTLLGNLGLIAAAIFNKI